MFDFYFVQESDLKLTLFFILLPNNEYLMSLTETIFTRMPPKQAFFHTSIHLSNREAVDFPSYRCPLHPRSDLSPGMPITTNNHGPVLRTSGVQSSHQSVLGKSVTSAKLWPGDNARPRASGLRLPCCFLADLQWRESAWGGPRPPPWQSAGPLRMIWGVVWPPRWKWLRALTMEGHPWCRLRAGLTHTVTFHCKAASRPAIVFMSARNLWATEEIKRLINVLMLY